MRKTILAMLCMAVAGTTSCAQQKQSKNAEQGNKVLVAYFSATGNTAKAAKSLQGATNGELYAITPEEPYTDADLDWNDKESRSSVEMNDPESRPAIKGKIQDIGENNVLFLGYPIWWDAAPRIINTFIEAHELKGIKIIPFATSGGSDISNSVKALKKTYPELDWEEGKLINGMDDVDITKWVYELEYYGW